MPQRIVLVDQRPDLLEFIRERLVERGYEVICVFTEDEVEAIQPEPDVVLVDFEEFGVDLEDVVKVIEESLAAAGQ